MQQPFHTEQTLPIYRTHPDMGHIPKQIGPYHIDSLLHRSSSGQIFLAHEGKQKSPIVIKLLPKALLAEEGRKEQFLKEAKLIQMSDHPNIVKVLREGATEDGLYIAMEFIRGVSLKQFIQDNALPLRRIIDILLQTAFALFHLHANSIIHRDLKPENILINEEGRVKIIDFGVASLLDDHSAFFSENRIIGTPGYMSPEQKKNAAGITFASDIFSFGVIAYELISGTLSQGKINLSKIPGHLRPIIEKCLQTNVQKRYQDIMDVIRDLSLYIKEHTYLEDLNSDQKVHQYQSDLAELQERLIFVPHDWIDMELAFKLDPLPLHSYLFDTLRLQNGSYLLYLIRKKGSPVRDLFTLSALRQIVGILLKVKYTEHFDLASFLGDLFLYVEEPLQKVLFPFEFFFLYLNPEQNLFSFCSSPRFVLHYLNEHAVRVKQFGVHSHLNLHARHIEISSDTLMEGDRLTLVPTNSSPLIEETLVLEKSSSMEFIAGRIKELDPTIDCTLSIERL